MKVEISNFYVWADKVNKAITNLLIEERETKRSLCQKENRLRKFLKIFLPFIKEMTVEDIVPEKYGILTSRWYGLVRYEIDEERLYEILDRINQLMKGEIDKLILDEEDLRLIEKYE